MKYWVWLVAKLGLAAMLVTGFWALVTRLLPPAPGGLLADWPRFGSDLPFTFAVAIAVILGFGLGWLAAIDQVYRCRICVRRLRMPQTEGNYSSVWLGGAPYTEYICTYGHGKLYVPEVHLASSRTMQWTGYGSLWENLVEADRNNQHRT